LRSRFGRAMLSSSQYGGVIKHLEPEHVLQLPVPTVGRSLVISLNSRMRQVFALRDAALRLTLRAENLYASVLGQVPDVDIDLPYAVPASNIFSRRRRLDAFHHNPVAQAITSRLRDGDIEHESLGMLVEKVFLPN